MPTAGDRVAIVGEGAGEALREPGCVPPQAPRLIIDGYLVDAEYTTRVEVVHVQLRLVGGSGSGIAARRVVEAIAFGDPDDGDRIRKGGMIGPGAVDQEPFAFQPFDDSSAVHDPAGIGGMGGVGGPGAHEPVERLQRRVGRHRHGLRQVCSPGARPSLAGVIARRAGPRKSIRGPRSPRELLFG